MERIGRFKILKRLGSGGFGEVWLGHDEVIKREVAIKIFKPKDENLIAFATSTNTEGLDVLRARFLSEAQVLGSLEHNPYVINVLEFGELDDGSPYYVMPFLPNSLTDRLGKDIYDAAAIEELPEAERPRALSQEAALKWLDQLLQGLAAAHDKHLVHRDIKPSNIMLTDSGEARLVDFGIAKAPDGPHSTVSQLGMGSRNYMAPEQRESAKHVDARADIYAVGVVAYRMLTGRLPAGRFSDPNVHVPSLTQPISDLIVACLAEDKLERPENAAVLLKQLRAAAEGQATGEETGTWVASSNSSLRDELRPLKNEITQLLENADGDVATGPYVDGKKHGQWERRDADGDVSTGPYVDGVQHGQWEERLADGDVATGPYVDDKKHGQWEERLADGDVFSGPYVDGKKHGRWQERDEDGAVDTGPYVDGKRHGQWELRYANGIVYTGPYVDGKRHGR